MSGTDYPILMCHRPFLLGRPRGRSGLSTLQKALCVAKALTRRWLVVLEQRPRLVESTLQIFGFHRLDKFPFLYLL